MKLRDVTKKELCFKLNEDVTLSDGESRKFRGVAYSGQMIMGHPFWGNLIFDISTMTFDAKIPVLFNHDPNRIVGSGTLEKASQLILNGEFSKTTPDGVQLFDLIKNEGFPMQESVFIEPEVEDLRKGKAMVNGIEVLAPATIFRNGKIREVSLTPLGADGNTSTQVFSLKQTVKVKEIKMTKKDKNFNKFSELVEAEDLEGAFAFACGCQEKKEFADDGAVAAKDAEIADLKAKLEAAMTELKALKDTKASEIKEGKIRKIKETFAKFDTEVSEDMIETYLSTADAKFDAVLAQVEANFKKVAGEKRFSNLTKPTKIDPPAVNAGEKEQLDKIRSKAADIRTKYSVDNNGMTMDVADSYAQARESLGIKE